MPAGARATLPRASRRADEQSAEGAAPSPDARLSGSPASVVDPSLGGGGDSTGVGIGRAGVEDADSRRAYLKGWLCVVANGGVGAVAGATADASAEVWLRLAGIRRDH